MTLLTAEFLTELASYDKTPCLSLFQPTHRHHPENQSDPVRFRNLVKKLEESLTPKYPTAQVRSLLEPFASLSEDRAFWNHTTEGLAVFAAPDFFRVIRLQRSVQELTIVADSFHTKPLRRVLQSADRYQLLGLSRHEIKFFEGNRDALSAVELTSDVTQKITDARGNDLTEPNQSVASYGSSGGVGKPTHHGLGGNETVVDIDADRFFRAVDRAVLEAYSRPSGLPLVLAALPEHHHRFRQVSHNPFLLAEGLTIHPADLPLDELRERAWQIFAPQHAARLAALADEYAVAKSKGLGIDDLDQLATAAVAGRIATLLIEADREIVGRIHAGTGNVHRADPSSKHPPGDDLLDDIGEWVIKKGGHVVVVPAAQMPTQTGLAATLRY